MSEYNKTILTNAGFELATKANKGKAKFTITKAATSVEKLADKSIAELQQLTELPSLMQYGTINDVTDAAQDSNTVIGTELVFNNKDLTNSYNINAVGLFAKEEGQDKEILYAISTATTPEVMPDYKSKTLFKFSMTMFIVIGKADNVSVSVTENGVVTKKQLDKVVMELQEAINKSGQVKEISINKGTPALPDSNGLANLTINNFENPDYCFSKSDTVDLDLNFKPGIYSMKDTTVTTSINKKALEGVLGGYDLKSMTGYMVVLNHDRTSIIQLLLLSAGVINPDFVIATRSIDDGRYRPPFRQLLNKDDKEAAKTAHDELNREILKRGKVFSVNYLTPNVSGNINLPSFENPNYTYAKNQSFDVDQAKTPGIYSFNDSKLTASIRTDALDGLPRTTDGTTMFGYLMILKHDIWNIDQFLFLNTGMETPDLVIATRSISGANNFRPKFRRLLNTDDAVHHCDDLASGIEYSKANPNCIVATS